MLRKIFQFLDFRNEIEDFTNIKSEIEKGIVFKGTNLWILCFAIVVASVGLNTNSTAVIIGAMLISPLMGPINGIGFGVATYDFDLFKKAGKNLIFAVVAGLAASSFYFALTPVDTAHSELLARINPTIYDVLIAFFGGLSGIVGMSSRIKGNIIPGVAIATALMPPLCTAGYGLGTGQFNFFFGAMYLFTINTVFIAISTVVISRFLKFPIRKEMEEGQKKRVSYTLYAVILITFLPSIYFGYRLVKEERFVEHATSYCNSISDYNGRYLLQKEINRETKKITLVYGGLILSKTDKAAIIKRAKDFSLQLYQVNIRQGISFDGKADSESDQMKSQLMRLNQENINRSKQIDSLQRIPEIGSQIYKEIKSLYPEITGCTYNSTVVYGDSIVKGKKEGLLIYFVRPNSRKRDKEMERKITNWSKKRLKSDEIEVLFFDKV